MNYYIIKYKLQLLEGLSEQKMQFLEGLKYQKLQLFPLCRIVLVLVKKSGQKKFLS